MTRNLKALCLTLFAVLAFSAMAASAAQAAPELTAIETFGEEPEHLGEHVHATVNATQDEAEPDQFTALGLNLSCTASTAEGTIAGTGTELTASPTYNGCKAANTFITHVNPNGCDYNFHTLSKVEADFYQSQVDVLCPTGQEIDLTITNLLGTKSICTVQIPEQHNLGPIDIRNMTESKPTDVTVTATISEEIEYTATNLGGAGCNGHEDGVYHDGSFTGNTTVTAENTANEPIDLEVSG